MMSTSTDIRSANAEPAESFLHSLGNQVRAARARHGMTRRDLARHSDVSERHLAQLESGKGNISIILLRQIAMALSTPVAELIDNPNPQDADRRMLNGLLDRLAEEQLVDARRMLEERFARQALRHRRLALIGLRGAGKSSIGRAVADARGVAFVELADDIESLAGIALPEIFEIAGQAGFRRYEREALAARLQDDQPIVLATGGGIVSDPSTFQMLLGGCYTVWLKADPEDHMKRVTDQGDQRPMAGNRQAMRDLLRILESREPLYAQADAALETSGITHSKAAVEVVKLWNEYSAL
jgi:XRE family aerobic/anaerobic benzoate catabolism transcriptional regulator